MHWFIDPIKNHYADFRGRASRQQLWMFTLWYAILAFVTVFGVVMLQALLVSAVFYMNSMVPVMLATLLWLVVLCGFLYILSPQVALQVRRLHDINLSGWWLLVSLMPGLGGIILLVLFCLPSKPGTNKWGSNMYDVGVSPDTLIS